MRKYDPNYTPRPSNPDMLRLALRGISKDDVTGEVEDYTDRWKDSYTRLVEVYGKESVQVTEYLDRRKRAKALKGGLAGLGNLNPSHLNFILREFGKDSDEVRSHLTRLKDDYGIEFVKNYVAEAKRLQEV